MTIKLTGTPEVHALDEECKHCGMVLMRFPVVVKFDSMMTPDLRGVFATCIQCDLGHDDSESFWDHYDRWLDSCELNDISRMMRKL